LLYDNLTIRPIRFEGHNNHKYKMTNQIKSVYLQKRIEQEIEETSSFRYIFLNFITFGLYGLSRVGLILK